MGPLSRIFPTVYNDSDKGTIGTIRSAVSSAVAVPENEIKRWRRTFDANAKVEVNGEKCVCSIHIYSSCDRFA